MTESKELLAYYATRGGKYEVRAYRHYDSHGKVYYSLDSLINGQCRASSYGLSEQELDLGLAREIFFAARYDGINYRPIKEWPATTRLLSPREA